MILQNILKYRNDSNFAQTLLSTIKSSGANPPEKFFFNHVSWHTYNYTTYFISSLWGYKYFMSSALEAHFQLVHLCFSKLICAVPITSLTFLTLSNYAVCISLALIIKYCVNLSLISNYSSTFEKWYFIHLKCVLRQM